MPFAGPGGEDEHQLRILDRAYSAPLVRLEVRQEAGATAGGAAVLRHLDLARSDEQIRPLVDLVLL
jgi:hypothetical protein